MFIQPFAWDILAMFFIYVGSRNSACDVMVRSHFC